MMLTQSQAQAFAILALEQALRTKEIKLKGDKTNLLRDLNAEVFQLMTRYSEKEAEFLATKLLDGKEVVV